MLTPVMNTLSSSCAPQVTIRTKAPTQERKVPISGYVSTPGSSRCNSNKDCAPVARDGERVEYGVLNSEGTSLMIELGPGFAASGKEIEGKDLIPSLDSS